MLEEIAHDPGAFTEGFEIDGGVLFEGTGLAGGSQLRKLDPATGASCAREAAVPGRLLR